MSDGYSSSEMMITAAARALAGARTVFVGVGLPNIACNLARRGASPNLELIYESGVFGARPARLPLSIGDPTLVTGAISVVPMADLFGLYLQGGLVDVALLGGAQIDRYGNLNTTVIGYYDHPATRLPGSGGACEIAANAGRVFYIMRLSPRSFVERLDFYTSPGNRAADGTRLALPGGGPALVITDKALFDFANDDGEMQLVSLHPGVGLDDVRASIGWRIRVVASPQQTASPSSEELRIIREELDTLGLYSGEK